MVIDVSQDNGTNLILNDSVQHKYKSELKWIFDEHYVKPERPSKPSVYSENKLNLNSNKEFRCNPRRLAYSEKTELQQLLDEYLRNEYIRPTKWLRICLAHTFSQEEDGRIKNVCWL